MSTDSKTQPLSVGEFEEWSHTVKKTLTSIEDKLGILESIATELRAIRENTDSTFRLYKLLDNRDQVFAKKQRIDLNKVGADFLSHISKQA